MAIRAAIAVPRDSRRTANESGTGRDQAVGEVVQWVREFDCFKGVTRSGVVRAEEGVVLGEVVEDKAEASLDAASALWASRSAGPCPCTRTSR